MHGIGSSIQYKVWGKSPVHSMGSSSLHIVEGVPPWHREVPHGIGKFPLSYLCLELTGQVLKLLGCFGLVA